MVDELPSPADEAFPLSGRLAGIDFGTVRIGVSVCDPLRILVSPLEIHQVAGQARDAAYFQSLVKREHLEGLVVGLPIHCDGGESDKSRQAREFARWLREVTSIPVRLFDERFTTSAAQSRMRSAAVSGKRTKHRRVDAIAAQVILESFLEAQRHTGELPGQSIEAAASGDQPLE